MTKQKHYLLRDVTHDAILGTNENMYAELAFEYIQNGIKFHQLLVADTRESLDFLASLELIDINLN
jgi:hypothetical protein